MSRRAYDFAEDDKLKALLWCERHCCLCDKAAGTRIEVAHLDPKRSDLDNAIPLCFDCHAEIGHYNREHPRGRKYTIPELRARRDQVYEEHTRRLVPPVDYQVWLKRLQPLDVGFKISNLGRTYPVRARVLVTLAQGSRLFGPPRSGHYDATYRWNLNPLLSAEGHFGVSPELLSGADPLRARVDVTIIDIYERPHKLLPVGFVLCLTEPVGSYAETSEEALAVSIHAS